MKGVAVIEAVSFGKVAKAVVAFINDLAVLGYQKSAVERRVVEALLVKVIHFLYISFELGARYHRRGGGYFVGGFFGSGGCVTASVVTGTKAV